MGKIVTLAKAELLTPGLVEITRLSDTMMQQILDNADPKTVWVKQPSWNRWMTTYSDRKPKTFTVRISKSEYDRLVDNDLIPEYLQ